MRHWVHLRNGTTFMCLSELFTQRPAVRHDKANIRRLGWQVGYVPYFEDRFVLSAMGWHLAPLSQLQIAAISDRTLSCPGETLQQPWQRHF